MTKVNNLKSFNEWDFDDDFDDDSYHHLESSNNSEFDKTLAPCASVKWYIKLLSYLHLIIPLSVFVGLGLAFAFSRTRYVAKPITTTLCVSEISKKEITVKEFFPNKIKEVYPVKQQVNDLELEIDVRVSILDHMQSLRDLLQVLAQQGNVLDSPLLLKILDFMDPNSLKGILNTLVIRLQLVKGKGLAEPLGPILTLMEKSRMPDFELNSREKGKIRKLLRTTEILSSLFVQSVRTRRREFVEMLMTNKQLLAVVQKEWNSKQEILNRLTLERSICTSNEDYIELTNAIRQLESNLRPFQDQNWEQYRANTQLSQAAQAVFYSQLSQETSRILYFYGKLTDRLPTARNIVMKNIDITKLSHLRQYRIGTR